VKTDEETPDMAQLKLAEKLCIIEESEYERAGREK